ncbi:hypothetical protein PtB15_7B344 [Puccinia triticina]|nr:hypothetical protein PtB15_7B344 [Puccinia triticina]
MAMTNGCFRCVLRLIGPLFTQETSRCRRLIEDRRTNERLIIYNRCERLRFIDLSLALALAARLRRSPGPLPCPSPGPTHSLHHKHASPISLVLTPLELDTPQPLHLLATH